MMAAGTASPDMSACVCVCIAALFTHTHLSHPSLFLPPEALIHSQPFLFFFLLPPCPLIIRPPRRKHPLTRPLDR